MGCKNNRICKEKKIQKFVRNIMKKLLNFFAINVKIFYALNAYCNIVTIWKKSIILMINN
jgi:hypothetical protein